MVICIAHQRNTITFVFAKNDVRWTIILTKTKWSLSAISPYPLAEMDRGSKSRGGGPNPLGPLSHFSAPDLEFDCQLE